MAKMNSLPLADAIRTIEQLPEKYAALAAIGVTTGCRISEITALRRMDLLDADGKFRPKIKLRKLKTGNKKDFRLLTIPADFRRFVIRHLNSEGQRGYERPDDLIFRGKFQRPLSRLTAYAVFRLHLGSGYGTHWMRKTFAQLLYRHFCKKMDPFSAVELVRQALGHKRIETTVAYLGIDEKMIEDAQNEIFRINQYKKSLSGDSRQV